MKPPAYLAEVMAQLSPPPCACDPTRSGPHAITVSEAVLPRDWITVTANVSTVDTIEAYPRRGPGQDMLHLIGLATHYLTDRQAQAGATLGPSDTWPLPALIGRVSWR